MPFHPFDLSAGANGNFVTKCEKNFALLPGDGLRGGERLISMCRYEKICVT
jgi:hypothetical protein